ARAANWARTAPRAARGRPERWNCCAKRCPVSAAALSGRPGAMASASWLSRLPLPFHLLARREVDFDPGAPRVEEEQLPQARRVAILGQTAQIVLDPPRLELGHIGRWVGPEKRN